MLEIQGEVIYKVLAYRRAAENIASLTRDVNDLRRRRSIALDSRRGPGDCRKAGCSPDDRQFLTC